MDKIVALVDIITRLVDKLISLVDEVTNLVDNSRMHYQTVPALLVIPSTISNEGPFFKKLNYHEKIKQPKRFSGGVAKIFSGIIPLT